MLYVVCIVHQVLMWTWHLMVWRSLQTAVEVIMHCARLTYEWIYSSQPLQRLDFMLPQLISADGCFLFIFVMHFTHVVTYVSVFNDTKLPSLCCCCMLCCRVAECTCLLIRLVVTVIVCTLTAVLQLLSTANVWPKAVSSPSMKWSVTQL